MILTLRSHLCHALGDMGDSDVEFRVHEHRFNDFSQILPAEHFFLTQFLDFFGGQREVELDAKRAATAGHLLQDTSAFDALFD